MKILPVQLQWRRKQSKIAAEFTEEKRSHLLRYACSLLGNRDDAEDAVQDLLLHFCKRLPEEAPHNPEHYLFRSLHNLCTDRLRRKPCPILPIEQVENIYEESSPDQEEALQRIQYLLSAIPAEQAEVIRLRFYADKSFQEISTWLNVPLPTIKSRFRYGLEKLKESMHGQTTV